MLIICKLLENQNFFLDIFKVHFKDLKPMPLRKYLAFNVLLKHKKDGKNILELIDGDAFFYLQKDYESLLKKEFKWEELEISHIESRSNLVNLFAQYFPPAKISLINIVAFEQLFPLKFIDLLFDCPNYSFGQPVYNKSLDFYTYLLDCIDKYYIQKDFCNIDLINAEDIHTYTPLSRYYVQKTNQNNSYIRNKYFNKEFNLAKFAVKLVLKFVPGATWRWVGGNHKCHIYSVKLCKIITEYRLVNEEELEAIKSILYSKISVFQSLEKTVNKDTVNANLDQSYIVIWRNGLIQVREYYAEILIHYLYIKQDTAVICMLKNIYNESLKNKNLSLKDFNKLIKFDQTILFEEEFGRKMMEFLMGYIISQNSINKVLLVSRKTNDIVAKFLYIISNVSDPYLMSLKLMREQDYINFAKINFALKDKQLLDNELLNKFMGFSNEFSLILQKISDGNFLYQETLIIKDILTILDKINASTSYMLYSQTKHPKNNEIQTIISMTNCALKIFNIMTSMIAYDNHLKENIDYDELFDKYSGFLQFYMNDNFENHCTFFVEEIIFSLENTLYKAPVEVSNLIYDIISQNSQIMMVKEQLLDVFDDIFKNLNKTLFDHPESKDYPALSKIMDCMGLFINFNQFKIFDWIPEYDIRMGLNLLKDNLAGYIEIET